MTAPREHVLAGSNLEIKARANDLGGAEAALREIGAEPQGSERQVDRYFAAQGGRIKLRTSSLDGAHLIVYSRPDAAEPEISTFHRLPVGEPDDLAAVLAKVLGPGPEIEKERRVWWWRDVRIHLDEVTGLGAFIELEARLEAIGDRAEADRRVARLRGVLGIRPDDLCEGSYRDMLT